MQTLDGTYDDAPAPAPPPAPARPAAALDRRSILGARPRLVPVDVPEWNGRLLLKPMSVATMARMESDREGMPALRFFPYLVAISACDEAGEPIFDEKDLDGLAAKDFDVLKRLADEILRINGLDGQVEARAKNS